MKKFISTILAICIVFALSISVFAINNDSQTNNKDIIALTIELVNSPFINSDINDKDIYYKKIQLTINKGFDSYILPIPEVKNGYVFNGWSFISLNSNQNAVTTVTRKDINDYGKESDGQIVLLMYPIIMSSFEQNSKYEIGNSAGNITGTISFGTPLPDGAKISVSETSLDLSLCTNPKIIESLKNIKTVFDINVYVNNTPFTVKDNKIKISLKPTNQSILNYKYFAAAYINPEGNIDSIVEANITENNELGFETNHLSQYGIIASNEPINIRDYIGTNTKFSNKNDVKVETTDTTKKPAKNPNTSDKIFKETPALILSLTIGGIGIIELRKKR